MSTSVLNIVQNCQEDCRHLIGEYEEICKPADQPIRMNPFVPKTERWPHGGRNSEKSVFDMLTYLYKLNSLLDWQTVFEDCMEFGIERVGTNPGFMWKGLGGFCIQHYDEISIFLNPHLNREETSEQIRIEQGIDIDPSEIYYWIWWHEIGHVVHGKELAGAQNIRHKAIFGGGNLSVAEREKFRETIQEADKKADEYANKRFLEWKD